MDKFEVTFIFVAVISICLSITRCGYDYGQDNMVQELCAKQQYDFCEIVEHKPEYRLKRERSDGN